MFFHWWDTASFLTSCLSGFLYSPQKLYDKCTENYCGLLPTDSAFALEIYEHRIMDNGLDKQPMYARSRTQTRVHLHIMTLSKRWITCIYSLNLNAYIDYQVPKQMQTHYILHGRVVVNGWYKLALLACGRSWIRDPAGSYQNFQSFANCPIQIALSWINQNHNNQIAF